MNEYASMFGLGEKTGVEISEAAGVLAGPASAERYNKVWQMGDTIQSGIGQSDNLFHSPFSLQITALPLQTKAQDMKCTL